MVKNSKIGLGTAQFGMDYGVFNKTGQTSAEEVKRILQLAKENEINTLDSASAYGSAEKVLGENDLGQFQIISKFLPPTPGRDITFQFYHSLQRLKVKKLYAYLAHRPMELLNSPKQWGQMKKLKEEGKVEKIGFSLNNPGEVSLLIESGFYPDLVQVPYNYFDRRFEDSIQELKSNGCEIHVRSVFLQGLFFEEPDKLDPFFNDIKSDLTKLQKAKATLAGSLLNFALEKPFIDKVIVGVQNKEQLQQNLKDLVISPALPKLRKKVKNKILIPLCWPQYKNL